MSWVIMNRLLCACADGSPPRFSLADADFCILHSPFVKMVRKGFARLVYQDHLRAKSRNQALQVCSYLGH